MLLKLHRAGHVGIALDLGEALVKLENFEEAIALLERIGDVGEDNPEVYYLAGRAFYVASRYEEAAESLLSYLRHETSHVPAINLLGFSYLELGLPGEALRAFETSLKLSPGQEDIRSRVRELKEKR